MDWLMDLLAEAPPPDPAMLTVTPLTEVALSILLWVAFAALLVGALVLKSKGD